MKKIAIIDDEVQITSMIEKYLKRNGDFSISVYNNPVSALSSLSKDTDVVLLDIMMPAYSTLDKVLEAHRQGAEDYVMKPFKSMSVITDKIKSITKT